MWLDLTDILCIEVSLNKKLLISSSITNDT